MLVEQVLSAAAYGLSLERLQRMVQRMVRRCGAASRVRHVGDRSLWNRVIEAAVCSQHPEWREKAEWAHGMLVSAEAARPGQGPAVAMGGTAPARPWQCIRLWPQLWPNVGLGPLEVRPLSGPQLQERLVWLHET